MGPDPHSTFYATAVFGEYAEGTTGNGARHGAQRAPWDGGRPRAAPAGGAEEPDALRGARRAGPQFPRPSRTSHPCRGA